MFWISHSFIHFLIMWTTFPLFIFSLSLTLDFHSHPPLLTFYPLCSLSASDLVDEDTVVSQTSLTLCEEHGLEECTHTSRNRRSADRALWHCHGAGSTTSQVATRREGHSYLILKTDLAQIFVFESSVLLSNYRWIKGRISVMCPCRSICLMWCI